MGVETSAVAGRSPAQEGRRDAALSALEYNVIMALRRRGTAGAAEVRADLADQGHPTPYTTVASALQRLHRRGVLTRGRERVQGGERYLYALAEDHPAVLGKLLDRLTEAFGEGAPPAAPK